MQDLLAELYPVDIRATLSGFSNCMVNLYIFLTIKTFPSSRFSYFKRLSYLSVQCKQVSLLGDATGFMHLSGLVVPYLGLHSYLKPKEKVWQKYQSTSMSAVHGEEKRTKVMKRLQFLMKMLMISQAIHSFTEKIKLIQVKISPVIRRHG